MRPDSRITRNVLPVISAAGRENAMNKENRRNILFLITYTVILILIINNISAILNAIGYGFQLLMPLWIGAVIAFIFDRPYEFVRQFLQSHVHWKESVTKGLSITIVYLLNFGFLVMILVLVVPQLAANLQMFADNIGYYSDQLQGFLDQITTALNISRIDISNIQQTISTLLASIDLQIDAIASQIIQVTGSIVSTIVTLCMSFILSIYLLFGKKKLFRQIKRVAHCYLPQHCITIFNEIYDSFLSVFTDYVSGQLREALILGSLCFIGMLILQLDYAALISAVVALTALIPILGAYIGGAVGVILLIFISPQKALIFLIFLIILQQVEGNLIYPRTVGHSIGLPGMWVLLAICIGGELMGMAGMLLGVPLAAMLYRLIGKDVRRRERDGTARS